MSIKRPFVLVVDDEPTICNLISDALGEKGYLCEVAQDGNSALQKMAEKGFDIALLDVNLPGVSGIELLREITSKYKSAVIMITALDDVNAAVESMKLGASDYIVKPFNLDLLNSSITAALNKNANSDIKTSNNKPIAIDDEDSELPEIDAIAIGIEVKLDINDKRSAIVTRETIKVARELGISEERIRQWFTKRAENNRKHLKTITSFGQNAKAQIAMGMTAQYKLEDNYHELEN